MSKLILFGAGAAIILDYEETCRRAGLEIAACIKNRDGDSYFSDASRLQPISRLDGALRDIPCLCPIFAPEQRRFAAAEAQTAGFRFYPALIDPTAVVASTARFGIGGYVNAQAIVAAACEVGPHVLINRGANIGHHCRMGEYVSVGPGAVISGFVHIGDGVLIGSGAVIKGKVRIGAGAILGAGAVVIEDVPPGVTVAGNPARLLRKN